MTKWHLAEGYQFAGLHCGIRSDSERSDLAIVVCDPPAAAAGVFTQNQVVAAPVQWCRRILPANEIRGIVICSGNANACTGQQGLDDAARMAEVAAEHLACRPDKILVCSTGVIGVRLPMENVENGIRQAMPQLERSTASLEKAANAILTTDTRIKVDSRCIEVSSGPIRVTGFAKGAAMIGPNMATMLAFILTDASVTPANLTLIAKQAADQTFNCISVEGHTSTNDTLLLLANGQGNQLTGKELDLFNDAVHSVCAALARDIAADAEGISHLIRIEVEGLRTTDEARRVAKTVADSALVKTAIFGADPNWGRIVSAAGYAGVVFAESQLSLWIGDSQLYANGKPESFDEQSVSDYIKNNSEVELRLRFTLGEARCTFWTSDLTYEYVRLNAEYTT